jgi:hypothetical protein
MRRSVTTLLVTLSVIVLLSYTQVFAGGGFGLPPERTVGPSLNVFVVMDATAPPPTADPTLRQFAVSVNRAAHSPAVMFTSTRAYQYGCQQPGFPSLKASTEQRFLGSLSNWAPIDAVEVLIGSVGNPEQATIVDILETVCTTVGSQEYLSFTGRIQFARP